MRTATRLLFPAVLLMLAAGGALAQSAAPAAPPALTVTNAWVRAIPGAGVAAVYLTLHNGGRRSLVITGVRCPLAGTAMIHETRVVNGVSSMRPHEPLVIAPGATIVLAPDGLHVMLHDLTRPLAVGSDVPLEIILAGGARIAVSARVRPLDAE